ncbi:MAG: aquaporin family protein [Deltaproteobacteria bacterium]|nr:aquaporin family protein [Deltaproteobacteria bacterium]
MHWTEYSCEFIGTAIHIFAGLMGIYLVGLLNVPDVIKFFVIGLFFAIGLCVVVYSPLGKRSGGHLNPAVTVAFWLNGLMHGIDAVCYIAAQFAGAVLGAWVAFAVFDWKNLSATLALPGADASLSLVLLVEFGIVFVLIIAIFAFVSSGKSGKLTGIAIGIYIVMVTVLFSAVSGAGLNPARNLGPALLLIRFDYILIYFTASVLGAFAAYGLFRGATKGTQPVCCKLCYKNEGSCLFKCNCEFKPLT